MDGAVAELQTCSRCHLSLPISSFGMDRRTLTGRRYECRGCVKESQAAYYRINRVKVRDRQEAARRKKRKKGSWLAPLLTCWFALLLFLSKIKLNA